MKQLSVRAHPMQAAFAGIDGGGSLSGRTGLSFAAA
jgi:hypothetical protein